MLLPRIVLFGLALHASAWENVTCKPVNTSLTSHCKGFLDGIDGLMIPDIFNESLRDAFAYQASQGTNGLPYCPFFDLKYQCNKYFSRCFNRSGVTHVQGMCQESCRKAKSWDRGTCSRFKLDCYNPYFYDNITDCFAYEGLPEPVRDSTGTIILVSILVGVAVVLLASLLVSHLRTKNFVDTPDASLDFADERRAAEKKRKAAKNQGEDYTNLELQTRASEEQWRSAQQARAGTAAAILGADDDAD